MRSRGDGPDPRGQRIPADRSERDRSQGRRRGHHHRAGLPAHADDVGPAHAARRHQGDPPPVPGAGDPGLPLQHVREGHLAAHEGLPFHPHHEPDGPAVPRQAAVPPGPLQGDRHDRRRRARPGPRSRSSCATSNATPTASACTSGCWPRSATAASMSAGR